MKKEKRGTSFFLEIEILELLTLLSVQQGISKSLIIEEALRELYKEELELIKQFKKD